MNDASASASASTSWYYILNWNRSQPTTTWSCTIPSTINNIQYFEVGTVKWRQAKRLVHLLYVPDSKETLADITGLYTRNADPGRPTSPTFTQSKDIKILTACYKSQLQKAIRRQERQIALETCKMLTYLDMSQLLRRLPIIMIEDTQLAPAFGPLVWLMSAHSKGFRLQIKHLNYLLGVVDWMVRHPVYDRQAMNNDYQALYRHKIYQLIKVPQQIPPEISADLHSLITTILYRQSYGGMLGDQHMLIYCATIWAHRNPQSLPRSRIHNINYHDIDFPKPTNWLPCAIDFHCRPSMLNEIAKSHPKLTHQHIKKIIWECQSKKNTRIPHHVSAKIYTLWEQIRDTYYQIRSQHLNLIVALTQEYYRYYAIIPVNINYDAS